MSDSDSEFVVVRTSDSEGEWEEVDVMGVDDGAKKRPPVNEKSAPPKKPKQSEDDKKTVQNNNNYYSNNASYIKNPNNNSTNNNNSNNANIDKNVNNNNNNNKKLITITLNKPKPKFNNDSNIFISATKNDNKNNTNKTNKNRQEEISKLVTNFIASYNNKKENNNNSNNTNNNANNNTNNNSNNNSNESANPFLAARQQITQVIEASKPSSALQSLAETNSPQTVHTYFDLTDTGESWINLADTSSPVIPSTPATPATPSQQITNATESGASADSQLDWRVDSTGEISIAWGATSSAEPRNTSTDVSAAVSQNSQVWSAQRIWGAAFSTDASSATSSLTASAQGATNVSSSATAGWVYGGQLAPSTTGSFHFDPPPHSGPINLYSSQSGTSSSMFAQPIPGLNNPPLPARSGNSGFHASTPRAGSKVLPPRAKNSVLKPSSLFVPAPVSPPPPPEPISPEDPITVLGVTEYEREFCFMNAIFTVRQLADASFDGLFTAIDVLNRLVVVKEQAKEIVVAYAHEIEAPKTLLPTLWGYHYVSEAVYQQIKEEKVLKSAFVLFEEYINCPIEHRVFHPWVRVYNAYLKDAAKWVGPKKKSDFRSLTDSEVYSFLVWRAAQSFAEFDCTAGPRAIYFTWQDMPPSLRRDSIAADVIIGEDQRNEFAKDRYSRLVRINLTELVQSEQGKIFRVENDNPNKWMPTTLEQVHEISNRNDLWKDFYPGDSFFGKVPHGCVVTPSGSIPAVFFDL